MKVVILGLSITSSWGNGHATTYRALVRELVRRGHDLLFLERDQPWYAANRDLPRPPFGRTRIYRSARELRSRFTNDVREADCVIMGSFVPGGIAVGEWVTREASGVTAFYDIDTPITLAKLASGECDYLSPELIPRFDLYLSFTGGPALDQIEGRYRSRLVYALYCSVDAALYSPLKGAQKWSLGYLGTFSEDRQPRLVKLLLEPAARNPRARFVVAGPQYPDSIQWPVNVERIVHLNPSEHRAFYNAQRFTLNITRAEMVRAGYSPSVRLFEAAACATPVISDDWPGLDEFFTPGEEILIAETSREVEAILRDFSADEAREIGKRARRRVLAEHTAAHRAAELESVISKLLSPGFAASPAPASARRDLAVNQ
jgi:spore maturation protein CgeB